VREFNIDFHGPLEELFPQFDALRDEGRVLWLHADGPGQPGPFGEIPGVWVFTDGVDVRNALQDPDLFSSKTNADGAPAMIPVFLDPPDHTRYRRLLNPLFAPSVVHAMESSIRSRIVDLIDAVEGQGSCDFVADVAVQFPTRVFTSWVGLPEEDTGRFVTMVHALIHGSDDHTTRDAALTEAFAVLDELVVARRAHPTDDLMSQIITHPIDGPPLEHDELLNIAFLLFLAGLDTVVAALSFSFWHLAQTAADRIAITSHAVSVEDAVEELLRRHSFRNLPRLVTRDTEFAGVTLRAGDYVILPTLMASRDPNEYEDPTAVQLDRERSRHFAFGLGPHRCLGSHLARSEMRIALDEWHRRIPDYELAGDVNGYGGIVMGVTSLPLRW
jgi:cytochrome P450